MHGNQCLMEGLLGRCQKGRENFIEITMDWMLKDEQELIRQQVAS